MSAPDPLREALELIAEIAGGQVTQGKLGAVAAGAITRRASASPRLEPPCEQ